MATIDIYTDGGCHGNPGPGGWAAIIYDGSRPIEISGHEASTTNQQMELRAAIEGLKYLENPRQINLYSDSAYLINGMNHQWHLKWEQNGWKNANKKPVKNRNFWEEVVRRSRYHTVEWRKVKGHSGVGANERCDALVKIELTRGLM